VLVILTPYSHFLFLNLFFYPSPTTPFIHSFNKHVLNTYVQDTAICSCRSSSQGA
jgi:hypothetical protein